MAVLFFNPPPPRPLGAAIGVAVVSKIQAPVGPGATPAPARVPPEPAVFSQPALQGPTPVSFSSPRVLKGRLVNLSTRHFRLFMFNPNNISSSHGWDWGSHRIPGASHPVLSGGAGAARTHSFGLWLDGMRGAQERETGEGAPEGRNAFSVLEDIRFYESFTYPNAVDADRFVDRGPARAILHLGTYFPGIEVVVRNVSVNVLQWSPEMEPVRATVDITFEEFMRRSITASEVFVEPVNTGNDVALSTGFGQTGEL